MARGLGLALAKTALIVIVMAGIGWGIWSGVERAFYKNPDFQLKNIDLNENAVIHKNGLIKLLHANPPPSLFDLDPEEIAKKLKALPGIADAWAERHLPNTLMVRVVSRTPRAWVVTENTDLTTVRRAGGMLVDIRGSAYPCPDLQLPLAMTLPIIIVPVSETCPIESGRKLTHPQLEHCFRLLESAMKADAEAEHWIDTIQQANAWSLLLRTREGTLSTFGLRDHERQIHHLSLAMDHANEKGYTIETINLMPKYNVPITLRGEPTIPRVILVAEPDPEPKVEPRKPSSKKTSHPRN